MRNYVRVFVLSAFFLLFFTSYHIASTSAQTSNPDFSTFINCIDKNPDGTYTAYFGYLNRLVTDTSLSDSKFTPTLTTTPPAILTAGRHDKAFSVTVPNSTVVVWTAAAGSLRKTATASSAYSECAPPVTPSPTQTPTPTATPTPTIATGNGSIKVCIVVVNKHNNIVNGGDVAGASLSVSGISPSYIAEGSAAGTIGTTQVTTPITYNSDLFNNDGILDSFCKTYGNLPYGHFFYSQMTITGNTQSWGSTLFNDGYSSTVRTINDFFTYDNRLFVSGSQYKNRNMNADGDITLSSSRKDRVLVVLAKYLLEDHRPAVTPALAQAPTPTPSPTPSPEVTPLPATITPTSVITTTSVPPIETPTTIIPTPIVTIIPTATPINSNPVDLPDAIIPARIDAQRVIINPLIKESVSFGGDASLVSSSCSTQQLSISFPYIQSSTEIQLIEYSINGGSDWYQVPNLALSKNQKALSIKFSTRSLRDNRYFVVLRVQTNNGKLFYSQTIPFTHNCTKDSVITSAFIRNGTITALLQRNDTYIINPSLPLSLFVESQGAFDNISVFLGENNSLRIPLSYDPITNLWKATTNPQISGTHTVTVVGEVDGKTVTKSLGKFTIPESKKEFPSEITILRQENDTWAEFPYEILIGPLPTSKHPYATLPAGTYLIKSSAGPFLQQSTEAFTLSNEGIVEVFQNEPRSWLDYLTLPLTELNYSLVSRDLGIFQEVEGVPAISDTQLNEKIVVFWNPWSPQFSEVLSDIEEVQSLTNIDVYIATNTLHKEELQRLLAQRETKLRPLILDSQYFIDKSTFIHPKVIFYRDGEAKGTVITGLIKKDTILSYIKAQ
jgi:hypothetical protein